jgi:hypothetical protein
MPTLILAIVLDIAIILAINTKVGHVTCDNASNNTTMMKEFAARLKNATGKKYTWKKRKIKSVYSLS